MSRLTTDLPARVAQGVLAALVDPSDAVTAQTARVGAVLLVLLLGGLGWMAFFNGGHFALAQYDWPKERTYFTALADALRRGVLPFYSTVSNQGTTALLANPEVPLTPDVLLLRTIHPATFVLVHTLLFFAAGLAGVWLLGRKLRLSALTLAGLALLALFNGHVVAHLAVGHSMWVGFLLVPWFVVGALLLVDEKDAPRAPALIALVVFVQLLAGALHVVMSEVVLLVALFALFAPLRARVGRTLLLVAGVAAVRLLPAAMVLGTGSHVFGLPTPDLWTFVEGFGALRAIGTAVPGVPCLPWWEVDSYVGLAALVLLSLFVIRAFRRPADPRLRRLALAALVLLALAAGPYWTLVHALSLPVLGVERVASRFAGTALVVFAAVAMGSAQRMLESAPGRWPPIVASALAWKLASDLAQHLKLWSMNETGQILAPRGRVSASAAIDLSHHLGTLEAASYWIGAVVTGSTLLIMIRGLLRADRRVAVDEPPGAASGAPSGP